MFQRYILCIFSVELYANVFLMKNVYFFKKKKNCKRVRKNFKRLKNLSRTLKYVITYSLRDITTTTFKLILVLLFRIQYVIQCTMCVYPTIS